MLIATATRPGPLPGIFGLHIASYIACELAGKPILAPLAVRWRKKLYDRLYKDLLRREEKLTGRTIKYAHDRCVPPHVNRELTLTALDSKLPIDEDDVALIFEDLHRGRSLVPPHAIPARPVLARWDPSRPLSVENCVAFDMDEAERHERECYSGLGEGEGERKRPAEVWGAEVAGIVDRRAKELVLLRRANAD